MFVKAVLPDEFFVRSGLDDFAFVHNDYFVGVPDGGKTMRDDKSCFAFNQAR